MEKFINLNVNMSTIIRNVKNAKFNSKIMSAMFNTQK